MPRPHDAMLLAYHWFCKAVVPNVSVAMMNLASTIIVGGAGVMLVISLRPSPIERVRTISIEPDTHVVDRSSRQGLRIVREITMRSGAEIRIIRQWVDEAGGVTPVLDEWVWLDKGTHVREPVRVFAPVTLTPGRYRYRVELEHCSVIPPCRRIHADDIDVMVTGEHPPPDPSIDLRSKRF